MDFYRIVNQTTHREDICRLFQHMHLLLQTHLMLYKPNQNAKEDYVHASFIVV